MNAGSRCRLPEFVKASTHYYPVWLQPLQATPKLQPPQSEHSMLCQREVYMRSQPDVRPKLLSTLDPSSVSLDDLHASVSPPPHPGKLTTISIIYIGIIDAYAWQVFPGSSIDGQYNRLGDGM
jgi:hypothetical protein